MVNLRNLGKYRIIAELGHGGMAEVFLSMVAGPLGSGFSKLAVVKRLRPNLVEDPDFIAMLVDEARISARLNHPNVVQTLEVEVENGEYFIAMEFLDGQPLHRLQRRAQRAGVALSAEHQYVILTDVLAGLQHAHELADYDGSPMGIVHRDVTPQNIFVTYDGQVKVVDFGIAKAQGRASETKQGIVKGKVRYMSPEQATGQHVDCRSDLFAVGVLLWEAATGLKFWDGLDELTILETLVGGSYDPSPRAVDASVPEAIDAICRKAMAYDRADRYDSAVELRADLETFLANRVVGARRSLGPLISELFAKERRRLREVIEQTSKGNVEPMSLVTFTAATASQTWSAPPSGSLMRLSTVPPPAGVPSLAPVMLSQSLAPAANDALAEEQPVEEPSSRIGGILAAVALAASIILSLSAPRLAHMAQGSGTDGMSSRDVAQVVVARTPLAETGAPRAKKPTHEPANMTTRATSPAAVAPSRAAHDVHEHEDPPATSVSPTPAAPAPTSGTLNREGGRRKPAIDTADPWSAVH